MTPVTAPRDWRARAACRDKDPDSFFPVAASGTDAYAEQAAAALATCEGCPVRFQCLEYALATVQEHGIWAGTAPGQRAAARQSLTRGAA